MPSTIWRGMIVFLGVGFVFLAGSAVAETIFYDDFSSATLSPEWNVDAGRGSYSLTANPGSLTYNLDSNGMTASTKPDGQPGFWQPSLGLEYSFEGTNWIMETHVSYDLHYWDSSGNSTGAQIPRISIMFEDDSRLYVERQVDAWYDQGSPGNHLARYYIPSLGVVAQSDQMLAPDDVVQGEWISSEYWYLFERNDDLLSVSYSFDGVDYMEAFTTTISGGATTGQTLILDATTYLAFGSTAQWDYILIESPEPIPEPASMTLLGLGLAGLAVRRLRKK